LRVTEEDLHQAIEQGQVDSIEDVFAATGAGQGCTACHRRILRVLNSHQQPAGM
jgi:bacterioferritin-associated ferredoxin